MSIVARCGCGKTMKVKDEYAGRKGKCPACGGVVQIPRLAAPAAAAAPVAARPSAPRAVAPAKPVVRKPAPPQASSSPAAWDGPDLDSLGELETTGTVMHEDAPAAAPPPVPQRAAPSTAPKQKACPACGGVISAFARVCEHCGASVATGGAKPMNYATPKKFTAAGGDDSTLSGGEIALCILCGGIAFIMGIVFLIQGKGKGWKMMALSFVCSLIWNLLTLGIRTAAEK